MNTSYRTLLAFILISNMTFMHASYRETGLCTSPIHQKFPTYKPCLKYPKTKTSKTLSTEELQSKIQSQTASQKNNMFSQEELPIRYNAYTFSVLKKLPAETHIS
jgi:hypothetical protein